MSLCLPSWAELCSDVVLLGKALCLHVHSLHPGVSGYLVGQWLVCWNSPSALEMAAGLHAPWGVDMAYEWTGLVTRGQLCEVGWAALGTRYQTIKPPPLPFLFTCGYITIWPDAHRKLATLTSPPPPYKLCHCFVMDFCWYARDLHLVGPNCHATASHFREVFWYWCGQYFSCWRSFEAVSISMFMSQPFWHCDQM